MIKKADILIIISVLIIIAVMFLTTFFNKSVMYGDSVKIYINGDAGYNYKLPVYERTEIEIDNKYGYNKIVIEGSSVCVLESDCSGKDCVLSGRIDKSGDFIICAPHRLIVRIENKKAEDMDAVTY